MIDVSKPFTSLRLLARSNVHGGASTTRCFLWTVFQLLLVANIAGAQPLFTKVFPPEEFAERRARVMEQIGDGMAVLQGAGEYPVYVRFRQNNNFFYLTGVEVPDALLLLDGRTKSPTLYLPPFNERMTRFDGPSLVPGEEAQRLTGIPSVLQREQFGRALRTVGRERQVLYTTFRRQSLNAAATETTIGNRASSADDPWDGRPSRTAAFIQKLRLHLPHIGVRDLDPILDAMRLIKSPHEIEVVREANRVGGRALIEMMRSTRPGMYEYEVEAIGQYFFHQANGRAGFYAQVLGGKHNLTGRYHTIEDQLNDGDMMAVDFGPDYNYYVADLKRSWPVNGKYTPVQRETYTIFLRFWEAMEQTIRPGVPPWNIVVEAADKMEAIHGSFRFNHPKVREAASSMIERLRARPRPGFGHFVGMDVHDVHEMGEGPAEVLKPGMVFSIEFGLGLRLPEDGAFASMEDNYLVTETGVENLSGFIPREPDDIEKLMAERGLFEPREGTTSSGQGNEP